jgi:hypothetical protein
MGFDFATRPSVGAKPEFAFTASQILYDRENELINLVEHSHHVVYSGVRSVNKHAV